MRFNLRLERQKVFNVSVVLLLAALALVSYKGGPAPLTPTASAQGAVPVPWTAVASTGVIDEAFTNFYAFGTTDLGFAGGGGQQILARYNVTNTYDSSPITNNPNVPGWRTLELGSLAPPGNVVVADLYRVESCTGVRTHLCRAFNAGGGGPKCDFCFLQNINDVDFSKNLYYIELRLFRNPGTAGPRAFTLRIY
jgi:hypothetical protein